MAPVTAVVWVVGLGLLWWRAEPLIRRIFADRSAVRASRERQEIRERAVADHRVAARQAVAEKRLEILQAVAEKKLAYRMRAPEKPAITKFEPMPADIREFCTGENQEWAREDKMQRANELYAQYGDWNRVRQALY